MSNHDIIRVKGVKSPDQLQAYGNHILVRDMEQGWGKTASGLITGTIEGHDAKTGMLSQRVPRWCQVVSVGEDSKQQGHISKGDWIMVEFNRWTPPMELGDGTVVNGIDEDSILFIHENDGSGSRPEFDYTEENIGQTTDAVFKHIT